MHKKTKKCLEKVFNYPAWGDHELKTNFEGVFLDFVIEAYNNGDKKLNFYDLKQVAQNVLDGDIKNYQDEQLGTFESIYLRGIRMLDKYNGLV